MSTEALASHPIAPRVAPLLPLSESEARELARAASDYSGGDQIRPNQAAAYVNLFATTSPTTKWARADVKRDLAGGTSRPNAITATYLAAQDLLARGWPARS